jgi:hypothetical protein
MNWRILWHAIRNGLTILGLFYLVSFELTLHTLWLVLSIFFLTAFFAILYHGEITVRELRLKMGWYV